MWVGAVCPTCHREIHHGKHGEGLNSELEEHLAMIEALPLIEGFEGSSAS
jgi:5-methylcytosine-specific restriction protein A